MNYHYWIKEICIGSLIKTNVINKQSKEIVQTDVIVNDIVLQG